MDSNAPRQACSLHPGWGSPGRSALSNARSPIHPTSAESGGIVPRWQDYSGSSIGNLPIGQGLAVTPIQMMRAYAAIANGGILVKPRLVLDAGASFGHMGPVPAATFLAGFTYSIADLYHHRAASRTQHHR